MAVRKFLSQRTVMPYSLTPPNPTNGRDREIHLEIGVVLHRARSLAIGAREIRGERLDLEAVDPDDSEAVAEQIVGKGVARGPRPTTRTFFPL